MSSASSSASSSPVFRALPAEGGESDATSHLLGEVPMTAAHSNKHHNNNNNNNINNISAIGAADTATTNTATSVESRSISAIPLSAAGGGGGHLNTSHNTNTALLETSVATTSLSFKEEQQPTANNNNNNNVSSPTLTNNSSPKPIVGVGYQKPQQQQQQQQRRNSNASSSVVTFLDTTPADPSSQQQGNKKGGVSPSYASVQNATGADKNNQSISTEDNAGGKNFAFDGDNSNKKKPAVTAAAAPAAAVVAQKKQHAVVPPQQQQQNKKPVPKRGGGQQQRPPPASPPISSSSSSSDETSTFNSSSYDDDDDRSIPSAFNSDEDETTTHNINSDGDDDQYEDDDDDEKFNQTGNEEDLPSVAPVVPNSLMYILNAIRKRGVNNILQQIGGGGSGGVTFGNNTHSAGKNLFGKGKSANNTVRWLLAALMEITDICENENGNALSGGTNTSNNKSDDLKKQKMSKNQQQRKSAQNHSSSDSDESDLLEHSLHSMITSSSSDDSDSSSSSLTSGTDSDASEKAIATLLRKSSKKMKNSSRANSRHASSSNLLLGSKKLSSGAKNYNATPEEQYQKSIFAEIFGGAGGSGKNLGASSSSAPTPILALTAADFATLDKASEAAKDIHRAHYDSVNGKKQRKTKAAMAKERHAKLKAIEKKLLVQLRKGRKAEEEAEAATAAAAAKKNKQNKQQRTSRADGGANGSAKVSRSNSNASAASGRNTPRNHSGGGAAASMSDSTTTAKALPKTKVTRSELRKMAEEILKASSKGGKSGGGDSAAADGDDDPLHAAVAYHPSMDLELTALAHVGRLSAALVLVSQKNKDLQAQCAAMEASQCSLQEEVALLKAQVAAFEEEERERNEGGAAGGGLLLGAAGASATAVAMRSDLDDMFDRWKWRQYRKLEMDCGGADSSQEQQKENGDKNANAGEEGEETVEDVHRKLLAALEAEAAATVPFAALLASSTPEHIDRCGEEGVEGDSTSPTTSTAKSSSDEEEAKIAATIADLRAGLKLQQHGNAPPHPIDNSYVRLADALTRQYFDEEIRVDVVAAANGNTMSLSTSPAAATMSPSSPSSPGAAAAKFHDPNDLRYMDAVERCLKSNKMAMNPYSYLWQHESDGSGNNKQKSGVVAIAANNDVDPSSPNHRAGENPLRLLKGIPPLSSSSSSSSSAAAADAVAVVRPCRLTELLPYVLENPKFQRLDRDRAAMLVLKQQQEDHLTKAKYDNAIAAVERDEIQMILSNSNLRNPSSSSAVNSRTNSPCRTGPTALYGGSANAQRSPRNINNKNSSSSAIAAASDADDDEAPRPRGAAPLPPPSADGLISTPQPIRRNLTGGESSSSTNSSGVVTNSSASASASSKKPVWTPEMQQNVAELQQRIHLIEERINNEVLTPIVMDYLHDHGIQQQVAAEERKLQNLKAIKDKVRSEKQSRRDQKGLRDDAANDALKQIAVEALVKDNAILRFDLAVSQRSLEDLAKVLEEQTEKFKQLQKHFYGGDGDGAAHDDGSQLSSSNSVDDDDGPADVEVSAVSENAAENDGDDGDDPLLTMKPVAVEVLSPPRRRYDLGNLDDQHNTTINASIHYGAAGGDDEASSTPVKVLGKVTDALITARGRPAINQQQQQPSQNAINNDGTEDGDDNENNGAGGGAVVPTSSSSSDPSLYWLDALRDLTRQTDQSQPSDPLLEPIDETAQQLVDAIYRSEIAILGEKNRQLKGKIVQLKREMKENEANAEAALAQQALMSQIDLETEKAALNDLLAQLNVDLDEIKRRLAHSEKMVEEVRAARERDRELFEQQMQQQQAGDGDDNNDDNNSNARFNGESPSYGIAGGKHVLSDDPDSDSSPASHSLNFGGLNNSGTPGSIARRRQRIAANGDNTDIALNTTTRTASGGGTPVMAVAVSPSLIPAMMKNDTTSAVAPKQRQLVYEGHSTNKSSASEHPLAPGPDDEDAFNAYHSNNDATTDVSAITAADTTFEVNNAANGDDDDEQPADCHIGGDDNENKMANMTFNLGNATITSATTLLNTPRSTGTGAANSPRNLTPRNTPRAGNLGVSLSGGAAERSMSMTYGRSVSGIAGNGNNGNGAAEAAALRVRLADTEALLAEATAELQRMRDAQNVLLNATNSGSSRANSRPASKPCSPRRHNSVTRSAAASSSISPARRRSSAAVTVVAANGAAEDAEEEPSKERIDVEVDEEEMPTPSPPSASPSPSPAKHRKSAETQREEASNATDENEDDGPTTIMVGGGGDEKNNHGSAAHDDDDIAGSSASSAAPQPASPVKFLDSLHTVRAQMHKLREDALVEEVERLNSALSDLHSEYTQLEELLAGQEAHSIELERQIADLHSAETDREKLLYSEIEELKSKIGALDAEHSEKDDEAEELRKIRNVLVQQNLEYESLMAESREREDVLVHATEEAFGAIEALEKDLAQSRQQNDNLKAKLKSSKQKVKKLKASASASAATNHGDGIDDNDDGNDGATANGGSGADQTQPTSADQKSHLLVDGLPNDPITAVDQDAQTSAILSRGPEHLSHADGGDGDDENGDAASSSSSDDDDDDNDRNGDNTAPAIDGDNNSLALNDLAQQRVAAYASLARQQAERLDVKVAALRILLRKRDRKIAKQKDILVKLLAEKKQQQQQQEENDHDDDDDEKKNNLTQHHHNTSAAADGIVDVSAISAAIMTDDEDDLNLTAQYGNDNDGEEGASSEDNSSSRNHHQKRLNSTANSNAAFARTTNTVLSADEVEAEEQFENEINQTFIEIVEETPSHQLKRASITSDLNNPNTTAAMMTTTTTTTTSTHLRVLLGSKKKPQGNMGAAANTNTRHYGDDYDYSIVDHYQERQAVLLNKLRAALAQAMATNADLKARIVAGEQHMVAEREELQKQYEQLVQQMMAFHAENNKNGGGQNNGDGSSSHGGGVSADDALNRLRQLVDQLDNDIHFAHRGGAGGGIDFGDYSSLKEFKDRIKALEAELLGEGAIRFHHRIATREANGKELDKEEEREFYYKFNLNNLGGGGDNHHHSSHGGGLNNVSAALLSNQQHNSNTCQSLNANQCDCMDREAKWQELVGYYRKALEANKKLVTESAALAKHMRTLAYLFETRPILVRALYELYKLLNVTLKLHYSHRRMANERQLSRQQALENNSEVNTQLDNAKEGNRWILANLFTSFELNHVGASPSLFAPDNNKRPTWRDVAIPERSRQLLMMREQVTSQLNAAPPAPPARYNGSPVQQNPNSNVTPINVNDVQQPNNGFGYGSSAATLYVAVPSAIAADENARSNSEGGVRNSAGDSPNNHGGTSLIVAPSHHQIGMVGSPNRRSSNVSAARSVSSQQSGVQRGNPLPPRVPTPTSAMIKKEIQSSANNNNAAARNNNTNAAVNDRNLEEDY